MQLNTKGNKKTNNKKYDYVCRVPNKDSTISNTSELIKLKKQYYQEIKKEFDYIEKTTKKDKILRSYYVGFVLNIYEFQEKIGMYNNLSKLQEEYKKYKKDYATLVKDYILSVSYSTELSTISEINYHFKINLEMIQKEIMAKIEKELDMEINDIPNVDYENIKIIITQSKEKYIKWCLYGLINIHIAKRKYYKEVQKELRKYKNKQKLIKIKKKVQNYLHYHAI